MRRLPDSPVGAKRAQDGTSQRRRVQPGSQHMRVPSQPGRPAPHTLQDEEGDSALFPKTSTGREASAFPSPVRQFYTTLTQTLL